MPDGAKRAAARSKAELMDAARRLPEMPNTLIAPAALDGGRKSAVPSAEKHIRPTLLEMLLQPP